MVRRQNRCPTGENFDECAAFQMTIHMRPRQTGDAEGGERGVAHHVDIVTDEGAGHRTLEPTPIALELPDMDRAGAGVAVTQAAVSAEVVGSLRGLAGFEIGGRDHEGERHGIADPHRDHVALQLTLVPHPAIEAFGHDVHEAVIDHEFQRDIGIGVRETGQARKDDVQGRRSMRVHPDAAGRARTVQVQGAERFLDGGQGRAKAQEEVRPRLRRGERAGRSIDETDAEPGFEHPHGVAEGGGGETEADRGPGEAAGLDDGREDGEPRPEVAIHS